MTILSTDIKLLASERMTDTTDGGGRCTANVIPDGVAGNIFPKVSRLDSVYGRVNLRKVYCHVGTANRDMYAGAHAIISDAPDNDRIHVTTFSTASEYDSRTSARDRIESYVIAGPESRMRLYGRQLVGAQALLVYQRSEDPLPEIGEVYAISNEPGGVTAAQQFVAIQDIDQEIRTFTDAVGDFTRRVVTLTIGAPLRYEFTGADTPSRYSSTSITGKVRSTTVADASRYYGIQPLSVAGHVGDLTVGVDSVYTPIVPTTQRETALSLATIGGAVGYVASAPAVSKNVDVTYSLGSTFTIYTGHSFLPGSVQVTTVGDLWQDNSLGTLVRVSGTTGFSITVSYELGEIYIKNIGTATGSVIAKETHTPAAAVSQPAHTTAIEVTLATRGTVYTPVLGPLPAPGTVMVDYRALGKWYRLTDDGAGKLVGSDSAYGTGTVNYVTGGVIITLGALPDVGSRVLVSWGSPAHYEIKTNDAGATARLRLTLPDLPVKRASAVVSYFLNGVVTTASANATGAISGTNSVTGSVNHVTGELVLDFAAKLPDAGTVVSVDYAQLLSTVVGETPRVSGSFTANAPATLEGAPLQAGSVSAVVPFVTLGQVMDVQLVDDGVGNLVIKAGTGMLTDFQTNGLTNYLINADTVVGTINYATGAVALTNSATAVGKRWVTFWTLTSKGYWVEESVTASVQAAAASYTAVATAVATSDSARTLSAPLDDHPLEIDLTRTTGRILVAGSVMFTLAGKTYFDRNGTLYTDMDPTTGSALAAGSIDYATGVVGLKLWAANTTIALAVQSCLTQYGNFTARDAFFRVAGSPIRSASLYVQVTATDGTLLTGLSNTSGVIAGTYMRGEVEQTMGVVWVEFGQMVTAAGNETEDWYLPANVVGGQVWKPVEVQPDTLRYSAVVLSNLPLNADILGLDPVRLPSDGRVPIYRAADVAVIHNTQNLSLGTPAAGSTTSMGRTNLAALWLEDANRLKLSTTLYVTDLAAGTVTMAADLSLAGYVPPINARHRIEEMTLLSDVQINGQLSLTAPLTREYPADTSFVSSALLFGDMFSRVTGVFDQGTWTSVWSDTLIGTAATAQYNDVDYPVEVLNSTAVSDRWRINFTSSTAFQVVSENMGVIGIGSTVSDLAPVNPLTGAAYFTLRAAGWGQGWSVGNQLRFNTVSTSAPMWIARTVLPGATLAGDSFDAQLRGDVD